MGIGSMKGRLIPFPSGGGGGGGGRNNGTPTLVAASPTYSAVFFEDFVLPLRSNATLDQPGWKFSQPVGTTGLLGESSDAEASGIARIACGSTSGNSAIFELIDSTDTLNIPIATPNIGSTVALRFRVVGSKANMTLAVGFTDGAIPTTELSADPDTTLGASANALLIHRSSAAYSGDAAGDLMLRWYDSLPGNEQQVLLLANASFTVGQWYRLEMVTLSSTSRAVYFDGALVATVTSTGPFYPCASVSLTTLAAGAKTIELDYVYGESALTAAR